MSGYDPSFSSLRELERMKKLRSRNEVAELIGRCPDKSKGELRKGCGEERIQICACAPAGGRVRAVVLAWVARDIGGHCVDRGLVKLWVGGRGGESRCRAGG